MMLRMLSVITLGAVLAACGGGGSSATVPLAPASDNPDPVPNQPDAPGEGEDDHHYHGDAEAQLDVLRAAPVRRHGLCAPEQQVDDGDNRQ